MGRQVKFNPCKKSGREGGGGLAILKVRHKKFWGSFSLLEVLFILEGGTKGYHPLKGGGGLKKFEGNRVSDFQFRSKFLFYDKTGNFLYHDYQQITSKAK